MGLSLLTSFDASSFFSHRQDHWDECVLFFEFAYNNSVNPSTGHSPFILSYAQSPRVPCQFLDTMLPEDVPLVDASQYTKLSVTQLASSLGLDIIRIWRGVVEDLVQIFSCFKGYLCGR